MINHANDENIYFDYDNRPIRPMDQDAFNEVLSKLPVLIDDFNSINNFNSNSKNRRQPTLAYSIRRKNAFGINVNQSLLNMTDTPMNNKRKLLGGSAPISKINAYPDLIQLKEENKRLEEDKKDLELAYDLLKKTHETELNILKKDHQEITMQHILELENIRNDYTMLLLEKETLEKMIEEYKLIKEENEKTIKELRDKVEQKLKLTNKTNNPVTTRAPIIPTSNRINSNKSSVSKTKIKANVSVDKSVNLVSARSKPKIVTKK